MASLTVILATSPRAASRVAWSTTAEIPAPARSWGSNPRSKRRNISASALGDGTWTSSLRKKRSSWASGSGYVPSYSIGFWVATTRNRPPRGIRWPSLVTWRSSIASRSAAWVLAGARLISSASSVSVKIGPGRNSKVPLSGRYTLVPMMSEGSRSGVNCTLLKPASIDAARQRATRVLAVPGTPASSTCPRQRTASSSPSITCCCPTTARPIVSWTVLRRSAATGIGRHCRSQSEPRGELSRQNRGVERSADRGHAPFGFERVDTAGQPEQLALRGTAGGHDPRLREEEARRVRPLLPKPGERRHEIGVGEARVEPRPRPPPPPTPGAPRHEIGVGEARFDPGHPPHPELELLGVAPRHRPPLVGAREEIADRVDVLQDARDPSRVPAGQRPAKTAAGGHQVDEGDGQGEQRGGAERTLQDGGQPLGPGPAAEKMVDLVEADPTAASVLDQPEDEGGRGPPPEPVVAQRVIAPDQVETAGADLDGDGHRSE